MSLQKTVDELLKKAQDAQKSEDALRYSQAALNAAHTKGALSGPDQPASIAQAPGLTDADIKHMVNRFLGWNLPENFNPDGGISFSRTYNMHTEHPGVHKPSGTNLFDYDQATAMVRYMIEGLPVVHSAALPVGQL